MFWMALAQTLLELLKEDVEERFIKPLEETSGPVRNGTAEIGDRVIASYGKGILTKIIKSYIPEGTKGTVLGIEKDFDFDGEWGSWSWQFMVKWDNGEVYEIYSDFLEVIK